MKKSLDHPVAITFTGGIDSTVLTYWLLREVWPRFGQKPTRVYLLSANYGQANIGVTRELRSFHQGKLKEWKPDFDVWGVEVKVDIPAWSMGGGLFLPHFKPAEKCPEVVDLDPVEAAKRTYDYAYVDARNAFIFTTLMSWCVKEGIPLIYTGHQYDPVEWDFIDNYRHRQEDFSPMFLDRMNLLAETGFRSRVRIEAPFNVFRLSKVDIVTLGHRLLGAETLIEKTYSCQFYPECGICPGCVAKQDALREVYGA